MSIRLWFMQFVRRTQFPVVVEDYMLSIEWAMAKHHNKPLPLMPYFNQEHQYVQHQIGEVVPFIEEAGWRAFYKVVNIRRPYGDYAGFDDGKRYDLVLDHMEKTR